MYNSCMVTAESSAAAFLVRPGGRVAYDVAGSGPLVVLVPGMGELRSSYRFVAPALRTAGYRVACTDLRGHGDSDATFASYGDTDTASDLTALIESLGGPAIIVGNSLAAGSAVLVAAQRPELVSGLALVGPYVRDSHASRIEKLFFGVAMARPWIWVSWKVLMPRLYAGRRPEDFEDYRRDVIASLRQAGHARALSLTTRTSHTAAEGSLSSASTPTLVIMGEQDPDFSDPKGEADWIAATLHGEVVMVSGAGHYPQSQQPEVTTSALIAFANRVTAHA